MTIRYKNGFRFTVNRLNPDLFLVQATCLLSKKEVKFKGTKKEGKEFVNGILASGI